MDIIATEKHVYYVPKFKQCLCGACFEPIYDDHADRDDNGFYFSIEHEETDEHCQVCVQSAED